MSESLIRLSEVIRRTGFSKAWVYRLISQNRFPKQISIGIRAVAFIESEIDDFIKTKISASRKQKTNSEETMTPSTLPQKCWKPLDDIKAYIGRFPDGVDLTMLNAKVCSYAALPKKEKLKIIDHLRQRESMLLRRPFLLLAAVIKEVMYATQPHGK